MVINSLVVVWQTADTHHLLLTFVYIVSKFCSSNKIDLPFTFFVFMLLHFFFHASAFFFFIYVRHLSKC